MHSKLIYAQQWTMQMKEESLVKRGKDGSTEQQNLGCTSIDTH